MYFQRARNKPKAMLTPSKTQTRVSDVNSFAAFLSCAFAQKGWTNSTFKLNDPTFCYLCTRLCVFLLQLFALNSRRQRNCRSGGRWSWRTPQVRLTKPSSRPSHRSSNLRATTTSRLEVSVTCWYRKNPCSIIRIAWRDGQAAKDKKIKHFEQWEFLFLLVLKNICCAKHRAISKTNLMQMMGDSSKLRE